MKKRIISFLLAMVLVLGLIPATATTANAYSTCATSAKAIDILKGSETFYEKSNGTKVGYSTPVSYEGTKNYLNGISKEDAVDLMRDYVEEIIDKKVNDFAKANNIDLAQHEHDALAVHIYRTGSDNGLFEAIREIKTVNSASDRAGIVKAFINSRGHTYTTDETVKVTVNVCLAEAAMYLYGDYGYNGSSKLGYARLSTEGDNKADRVVGFVKADGLALAKPNVYNTADGLEADEFLGWFLYDYADKKPVGAPLTKLTKDHSGKLIIAKKATGGNVAAEYTINTNTLSDLNVYSYGAAPEKTGVQLKNNTEFKVAYEFIQNDGGESIKWVYGTGKNTKGKDVSGWIKIGKVASTGNASDKPIATATVTSATLNIRAGATTSSDLLGELTKNQVVNIYETKVEKTETGNQTWGKIKLDNGTIGWINLAYADVNETLGESGKAEGQTGKIANSDTVNIRKKASVHSDKLTYLDRGTKVTVLEMNEDRTWAKIKWETPSNGYTQGWVYMHYVQLDSAYAGSTGSSSETVKYTGVVTSNINLNVRKSADIYSAKVDSLPNGTKVNIYETKTKNNMKWGRIGTNRWVCLAYVSLTEVEQPEAGSTTTTTSIQATVTSATLDVLKNYNNNAEKVGTLKKGDVVTILEKNTESTGTGSRIWGRISKDGVEGWINLAYVELKTVTSVSGNTNTSTSTGTTNANGASAVISNCISVNVREGAGVSNAQITKLNNGTAVKVYEQVTKDNAPWAKITWNNGANSGWVCMNYVTVNNGTVGGTTEGGLVNGTNSNTISATGVVNSNIDLNVRSVAGLNGIKLGSLKKGTKVTIYEQVSADGMIWGRIQYGTGSGWICMSYISIESASSTGRGVMGTIARCFAAVNVRSAPGTNNALINKIAVGTRVEVFETKTHGTQLWGRVAQGWICMDYVLLDSELPEGEILDAPTTAPSTEASTTAPEETINKDNEVGYIINGTINGTDPINVRNDADVDSDRVGTVNGGLTVKILALKQNGAELWGRIDQYATAGWIRMDLVSYSVHGYVNTEEQPVYANADTSSTVKENLAINTELTISKLTVGGETVYGWVNDANGWIPMGRISNEKVDVIPVYKSSTDSFGSDIVIGTTNTAADIVSEINGSKVVFKLQSGVKVYVAEMRIESGIIWGKLTANGTIGWINMAKVNYQLYNCGVAGNMNVRSSKVVMAEDADPNNVLGTVTGTVTLCELSFDGDGNLWGKVTAYTDLSGVAVNNGGYIMVRTAGGDIYVTNTGVTF